MDKPPDLPTMNFMLKVTVLVWFGSSIEAKPGRCLLLDGKCVRNCPSDMHAYHTRCDEDAVSQRTCRFPMQRHLGYTCGWSRCDCKHQRVYNEEDRICIRQEECPDIKKRPKSQKQLWKDQVSPLRIKPSRSRPRVQFHQDSPAGVPDLRHEDYEDLPPDGDTPNAPDMNPPESMINGDDMVRYTGHCPLLKFRYGKCYGDNTRQILKEIRQKGLYNKPLVYRPGDNYEIDNMPRRERPLEDVYDALGHRQSVYMTGYTGYVPGMNFRYGKSYGRAADDCMTDFTQRQRELRRKADLNKCYVRSQSAPKMETIRSRDEIRRELNKFREINKYKENTISPEFPPIAGYTGHIPRIKGSEASLSQRYHCAAKRGLELIRIEQDKRHELQNAAADVRELLRDNQKKTSYYNWG